MPKLGRFVLMFLGIILVLTQQCFPGNKVITRVYKWKIRTIPNFEIYYYGASGLNLLPYAETFLQNAHQKVAKVLPRLPAERTPFFLYNNHNEYEESNITSIGEGTGGVTEASKNRFLVGFTGSQRELEYIITHEYSHEAEYEYLFSGFWRSIRLVKFVLYPHWLMEGLAEYNAGEMDRTAREMYLRDAVTGAGLLPLDHLHNFTHVLPHQITLAYKESEGLMRFVAQEYGEEKLPMLLESFRDRYDSNSVLADVLGTDLASLDLKFREHMEYKYSSAVKGLAEPDAYGCAVTSKGAYRRFFESAVPSPDGKYIAYISDESGRKNIYLADLSGREPELLAGPGSSIRIENISTEGNGLAYADGGAKLIFCGERLQKDYIFMLDLRSGRISEFDPGTETAASPVASKDGAKIYFSAIKDGSRNIFQLETATGKTKMLTAGPYDKIDAELSPNGDYLVFSEEKPNAYGRPEYDINLMNLADGSQRTVIGLPGDERYPCFTPDGSGLYFCSDMDGINDIYRVSLEGGGITRLTKVIGGNFQPKISGDGKTLVFSSFRKGEKHVYAAPLDKLGTAAVVIDPGAVPEKDTPKTENIREISSVETKNYRFRASTDFFIPVLLYSSLDGLYTAFLWQGSDYTGDNAAQAVASYASGLEYLDYQLVYGFLRYRPQFYFSFTGKEYFADREETDKKIENSQTAAVEYPLNRFQKLQLLFTTIDRKEIWKDEFFSASARSRENVAGLAFMHDTVTGPYLEPISGGRFILQGEFSDEVFGGNYIYQNAMLEINRFLPLGRENTLGIRALAGASYGRNAGYFRLGGADRVRAVPEKSDYYGKRLLVTNLEWRFPISHNLNYHMWYMFPDFFFKTFYGSIFADAGTVYNEGKNIEELSVKDWKGSYGVSLRIHAFIMEIYDLPLNFQLAQRMDSPGWVFYFTAGAAF